jgi:hypothetical protein
LKKEGSIRFVIRVMISKRKPDLVPRSEITQLKDNFPAKSTIPGSLPQTKVYQFVFPHAELLTPIQEAKHGHI